MGRKTIRSGDKACTAELIDTLIALVIFVTLIVILNVVFPC